MADQQLFVAAEVNSQLYKYQTLMLKLQI